MVDNIHSEQGDSMTIHTYEMVGTHPDLDGPLVFELIATSDTRAIARARMAGLQMYGDDRMLEVQWRIATKVLGAWPLGAGISIHGITGWCGPGCEPATTPPVHSSAAHAATMAAATGLDTQAARNV